MNCVLERAVGVEDLDALVAFVGHVDVPCASIGDAVDDVELAGLGPARAPRLDVLAVRLVLRDARVAVAVGDVDVAGRVPGDIGGPLEALALGARARQPAAAAAATAAAAAAGAPRPAGAPRRRRPPAAAARPSDDRNAVGSGVERQRGTRSASGLRLRIICTRPFGSNLITCVDI